MNYWKTLAIASTLIILPVSTFAAKSQPTIDRIESTTEMNIAHRSHHGKGMRGRGMERLLSKLDLSAEQTQQIEAIKEQSATATEDLYAQMETQHQEMRSLLASDANVDEIRSEFQASQQLRQQLDTNRFETMLQIREILTPEQKAQVAELMQNRSKRFER